MVPSTVNEPTLTGNLALLTFRVAQQRYSFPVSDVVRIIEMVTITHLPQAPDNIQGIINLLGRTVAVLDLRHRFGLPRQAYGLHTPIILTDMSGDGRWVGLIVDTVEDVLHVPQESLELAETIVPSELVGPMARQAAHLAGVAKVDRGMILVLDARALLNPTEQTELSQALDDEVRLEAVGSKQ